jgi:hypothetical protein
VLGATFVGALMVESTRQRSGVDGVNVRLCDVFQRGLDAEDRAAQGAVERGRLGVVGAFMLRSLGRWARTGLAERERGRLRASRAS